MTNVSNKVLYCGVTGDLVKRVWKHKQLIEGFTKKYKCVKLVYYEMYEDSLHAIGREKQIKAGSRKKKDELVNTNNPEWKDLYSEIV